MERGRLENAGKGTGPSRYAGSKALRSSFRWGGWLRKLQEPSGSHKLLWRVTEGPLQIVGLGPCLSPWHHRSKNLKAWWPQWALTPGVGFMGVRIVARDCIKWAGEKGEGPPGDGSLPHVSLSLSLSLWVLSLLGPHLSLAEKISGGDEQ